MLTSACAAGLLALAAPAWVCLPASAEETDGTITVQVLRDVNGNGEVDSGDEAQSGIHITVTDVSGATATGTTNDEGEYVLKPDQDLKGGRYFVVADIPSSLGLEPVPASDTFQALSTTVDVTSSDETVHFGVVAPPEPSATPSTEAPSAPESTEAAPVPAPAPAPTPPPSEAAAPTFAVGDRVWLDADRQGTQDDGELPARQVSVQLLGADGTVLDSTVSRDGRYLFDGLRPGVYSVQFSGIASGFRLSPTGVGSAAADSDPDYTGATPPFTLGLGAANVRPATAADHVSADYINPTIDAGIAPVRYAIASSVWQDSSGDGLQQAGEPAGQARVTLLRAGSEAPQATVTTDASGAFRFENLDRGTYRLRFDDLGAHRQLTAAHVGSNRAIDSDPDPRTRTTAPFVLDQASTDLVPARDFGPVDADFVDATVGAGVVGSYSIRNRVWNDLNGDGLFSPGEHGIPGVEVQVLDAAGAVVATTTTDAEGIYDFSSLPAGRYQLRIRRYSPELHPTATAVGTDRGADSDLYADSLTAPITVGEEHPVEDAVSVGLTSTTTVAATDAPSTTPVASSANASAPAALGATGGVSTIVPAAGAVLLLAGGGLLWLARRRRRP
ncbi:SdrD B-like domain-containing protein [uncultured Friedmanniella sp.]|uniref:SdrD B-like domain-containing protein n=1 Tax=uncultured Friedmanniella sp. TaxID=335381 RepID=UPI0035CB4C1C